MFDFSRITPMKGTSFIDYIFDVRYECALDMIVNFISSYDALVNDAGLAADRVDYLNQSNLESARIDAMKDRKTIEDTIIGYKQWCVYKHADYMFYYNCTSDLYDECMDFLHEVFRIAGVLEDKMEILINKSSSRFVSAAEHAYYIRCIRKAYLQENEEILKKQYSLD